MRRSERATSAAATTTPSTTSSRSSRKWCTPTRRGCTRRPRRRLGLRTTPHRPFPRGNEKLTKAFQRCYDFQSKTSKVRSGAKKIGSTRLEKIESGIEPSDKIWRQPNHIVFQRYFPTRAWCVRVYRWGLPSTINAVKKPYLMSFTIPGNSACLGKVSCTAELQVWLVRIQLPLFRWCIFI